MLLTDIVYQDFFCILCHTGIFIFFDFLTGAGMDYRLDDRGHMVLF